CDSSRFSSATLSMFSLKSKPTTSPLGPVSSANESDQSPVPQQTSSALDPFVTSIRFMTSFRHDLCLCRDMIEFIVSYLSDIFSKTLCTRSSFDCSCMYYPSSAIEVFSYGNWFKKVVIRSLIKR